MLQVGSTEEVKEVPGPIFNLPLFLRQGFDNTQTNFEVERSPQTRNANHTKPGHYTFAVVYINGFTYSEERIHEPC
jgi:hypothetical protein